MNEGQLKRQLQQALESADPPDFDDVWLAAEARYLAEKQRYRRAGGIAASIALIVVAISLLPERPAPGGPEFAIGDDILASTLWTAPSDVLMPRHRVDVYRDIPELIESTELPEGALL